MPFSGNCRSLDFSALKALSHAGEAYGLYKVELPFRPDHYTCLSVGQTNDLRTRMPGHYNTPPITGVTHFLAEAIATEKQRKQRERELILEFDPSGNGRSGAGHNNVPDVHKLVQSL
jgi:hypothetical protein